MVNERTEPSGFSSCLLVLKTSSRPIGPDQVTRMKLLVINQSKAGLTFAGILTWAINNALDAQRSVFAFTGGARNRLFSTNDAWAVNAEVERVRLRTSSVGSSAGVLGFIRVSDLAEDEISLGNNGAGASAGPLNLWRWVSTRGASFCVLGIISSLVICSGDRRVNV